MAGSAGRLIAARIRFRLLPILRPRLRLSGSGTRLCLAPLEVLAERGGEPGFFSGIGGVGFFGHFAPGIAAWRAFQGLACERRTPMANPLPRGPEGHRFNRIRCRSSVVEHLIGNEEVHSSILCGSTSPQPDYARLFPAPVERRFFRAFLLLRFRQGDGFGSLAHQQARDEGQQRCDQKKADQMVRADEGRV